MSMKQDELWLLKPHKHGESLFGLLLNPRPHECLIPNSIPHVRQPMVTLWRSRTEGVEGVKLTAAAVILRLRSLAGAQAHETEVLAASSRITSDAAATTPTRVPTGPTVFPEHLQLPP